MNKGRTARCKARNLGDLQLAQAPHQIVKHIFPNAAWRLNRRALKAASLARPLTPRPREIRSLFDR